MAEIVNLRRARKAKARAERGEQAAANRLAHGTAKRVDKLTKARSEKDRRTLDDAKLDQE